MSGPGHLVSGDRTLCPDIVSGKVSGAFVFTLAPDTFTDTMSGEPDTSRTQCPDKVSGARGTVCSQRPRENLARMWELEEEGRPAGVVGSGAEVWDVRDFEDECPRHHGMRFSENSATAYFCLYERRGRKFDQRSSDQFLETSQGLSSRHTRRISPATDSPEISTAK